MGGENHAFNVFIPTKQPHNMDHTMCRPSAVQWETGSFSPPSF